ncbi:MAG: sugar transferase [Sedimentisphaerales bacterium]|nr:sugar transferase [Sedimentisphaerales bacterium]
MSKLAVLIKRAFDILFVLAISPLLLIVIGLIAIIVRLTSGSPVFFRQERAGRNMQPFTIYKFRTMHTDIDPFGPSPKAGSDDRMTCIGNWLRKYSLDELPQFFNVLKGNMSLVGPRPLYMDQARQWNERQKRRLLVEPGLTGLAQISGRGNLTIEDKLDLDVRYADNQSLWRDLRIFIATFFKVLRPKDIYEKRYSRTEETRKN